MGSRRASCKRKNSSGRTKAKGSGWRHRGTPSKSKGQANGNGNTDGGNHNPLVPCPETNDLDRMPQGGVFLADKASPHHRPSHINNFINANSGRSSACSDEGHYSRCSSSTPSSDAPSLGSYNFDSGHMGTPSMRPPSMKTPSLFSQSFDSSMDASSLDCESNDASTCGIAGTPRKRHSLLEISSSMDDSMDDIRARKRTEKRKRYRQNKRLRVLAALHMKDEKERELEKLSSGKNGETTIAHESLRHSPIKVSPLVAKDNYQLRDSTPVKEHENCDEIVDEGFSENFDKAQRKECEDTFVVAAVSQGSCENLNTNPKDICATLSDIEGKNALSSDMSNDVLKTLVLNEKNEYHNEQKQVDGEKVNGDDDKGQVNEETLKNNDGSTSSSSDDCTTPAPPLVSPSSHAEENVHNVDDDVLKDEPNSSEEISSTCNKDGIEEIETVHCTRAIPEEISSVVIDDNIHLINPNDKLELADVIETKGCSDTLVVLEMKNTDASTNEEDSETEDGGNGEDEQLEIQIVDYDDGEELVDILKENGEENVENKVENNNISGKDANDSEVYSEDLGSAGKENECNKETEPPVANVNGSCQDAANDDVAEKLTGKVDAALAELDSIPDGVCESGEVEEEEEEEEEWSYYRMEPQTQPQGEDLLGVTASSTSPKEDVEILPEPSDMVQDQDIVPVPEQKDNTDVSNIHSANIDVDSPFELPPNNEILDNLIKDPIVAEKNDILESNMDVIPSLDDHPERLINFSGPGLEKPDMDINMEQSSPHGSGSPKVPGSPRSVEGFVTSVELNTPDESFATNFAVNQAQDAFTGGIVDQTSGPFSVYVSSSPEPASLDPPQQASIDLLNMSNGMTNGQMDDEHSPMNEAQVAQEESPSPVAREESPVEIVHAQSTVEVLAPPSPVEVSGPETQFIMPDQQVPDVPCSAQMPPTDISFVPQPVIEPTAEVPVPVYVDDTPISESDLILENRSNTAEIPSPTTFESESMMQMDMQSSIIVESSTEVVSEQTFEASKTEVSETVSQMETNTTSHFETDNEANQNEFSIKSMSPIPALSPKENAMISSPTETLPLENDVISSPIEASPVENALISSPTEPPPVENALISSPTEASPVENAFISSPIEASPVPKELDNVPAEPSPVEEKEPIIVNDVVTPVETELASPPVNIPEVSDTAEVAPKPADVKTKSLSNDAKASKTPKTPGKAVSDKTPAKGTPGKSTPSKTIAAKATPTSRTPSARTPSSKTPTAKTPLTKSTEKKTPITKAATPSKTATTKPSTAKPTSATTKSAPAKNTAPKPASRLTTKPSSTTTTKSLSTPPTKPLSTAAKTAPKTAGATPPKSTAAKTTTRPLPSARTTTTTKTSTTTAKTSTTTTARKPISATKSTDKPDSATTRPTSRPGVAKPSSTTTRRPASGTTAKTTTKPGAEKETKNTTNQILSSRPTKPATSATARTTGARSSTAHSTTKTASANTATKRTTTTASKTTGAATKKTLVSKSKTASTKETALKNETSVIDKAEPLVNGENKIADEETSVEVIEKSAVEDIMIASNEKVITETMSSEQVLVTTEATEVLVNGDH